MTLKKIINDKVYSVHDEIECEKGIFPAWIVQPGFFLKGGELVYRIEWEDNVPEKSFYFLHIPKTSGMSVKEVLLHTYKDHRIYSNFLQYLDDKEMLKCDFISGHFALYPIELFKKHEKKLFTYTILRNPTDRYISNYLYKNENPSLEKLEEHMFDNRNDNMQYKYLTCTLNMSDLKRFYDKLASKEITFDQYKEFSLSYNDLIQVYSNIDSALSNIDYIETIDNQNDLSNLNNFLEKNINISLSTKIKGYQNTGSEKNNEFKKTIPDSFRKLITEKQNLDYELYEKVKMGYYKE
jgi:hypothetical protein